jgi:hypothetical protein
MLIVTQQFGVNDKGVVNTTNVFVKYAQVIIKNIARSYAFVDKEQWNVL